MALFLLARIKFILFGSYLVDFCLLQYLFHYHLDFLQLTLVISIAYILFKNEAFLYALFALSYELFSQNQHIQVTKSKGKYIRMSLTNKKNSKVFLSKESHLLKGCFHH